MLHIFSDEYFMKKALDEANIAFNLGEVPIGCVIVCDNKIIARAHNMTEKLNDVTAHAEMQAITAAANQLGGKYLTECSIYVTIEPCPMCAGALNWAQIKKVVYGAKDDKRGYSKYSPDIMHPKTNVIGGILQDDCSSLMRLFFTSKRD